MPTSPAGEAMATGKTTWIDVGDVCHKPTWAMVFPIVLPRGTPEHMLRPHGAL